MYKRRKGKGKDDDVLHKKDKEVIRDTYIRVGMYGHVEGEGKGEQKQTHNFSNKYINERNSTFNFQNALK